VILISPQPPTGGRPAISNGGELSQERTGATLAWLRLSDFRCYVRAELDLAPRPVVLTGPNGAGKTNLLEAISLLAPGRGLRRALLGALDRRPRADAPAAPGPWAVAAGIRRPEGDIEIGTGRDPAAPPDAPRPRRLVKIDGGLVRGQAALAAQLTLSWLTPQMDRLFLDGSSERRRFLDRLVYGFDPEHAARLAAYEHALRERARLLRGEGPTRPDPAWLDLQYNNRARIPEHPQIRSRALSRPGRQLWVTLRGRRAILPMHGSRKEMKSGTVAAIKKQLGLT